MVTPEEAVPEEDPVPGDAKEEHPGRFAAGLTGKRRAERVDSPGEDRMPGSVQSRQMMHPGDVEQELLDPPGLLIVKVFLHRWTHPFRTVSHSLSEGSVEILRKMILGITRPPQIPGMGSGSDRVYFDDTGRRDDPEMR